MSGPIALPGAPLPMSTTTQAAPQQSEQETALRRAAQEFESVFLSEMLAHSGLGEMQGSFGGGQGEAQFSSFLRDEQAKLAAERLLRTTQLEAELADLTARQSMLREELIKAEAHVELISDLMLWEKAR